MEKGFFRYISAVLISLEVIMDEIGNVFYFVIIVLAILTKIVSAKNAEKQAREQKKAEVHEDEAQDRGRRVIINPDGTKTIVFDRPQTVETRQQNESETREDTIQKALEEIKRRTEAERIETEKRRKREDDLKRSQIREKQKKYETKMSVLNTEEGVSSTGFKPSSFPKKSEEEESTNVSLDITNMDEVRRAFIYSEIFERKY